MNIKVEMVFDEETLDQVKQCRDLLGLDSIEVAISRAVGLVNLTANGNLFFQATGSKELNPIEIK